MTGLATVPPSGLTEPAQWQAGCSSRMSLQVGIEQVRRCIRTQSNVEPTLRLLAYRSLLTSLHTTPLIGAMIQRCIDLLAVRVRLSHFCSRPRIFILVKPRSLPWQTHGLLRNSQDPKKGLLGLLRAIKASWGILRASFEGVIFEAPY